MPSVIIVGAGISGLSAAYRLQELAPDAEVTVLEQNPRPGGTIWTEERDGFRLELGPNGFLDNKPGTLQLCRDVGLGDRLVAASAAAGKNRYLFLGDGLRRLPGGPASLVTTKLLSWKGKLSLVMERFRKPGPDGGDESVDAFARRRAGDEAADLLADAMVTGIYAGDPKLLSVGACFPRLPELEREYGSVIKGFIQSARRKRKEAEARGEAYQRGSNLWSFREGLKLLVEAVAGKLRKPPELGVAVTAVRRHTGDAPRPSWAVDAGGRSRPADAVVLTCPSHRQAELLAGVDEELTKEVREVPYNRVAVIGLGYRRADVPGPVDGFGFIAPQRDRRDILGVQWCSSIYPGRAPEGFVLLRAMAGGWHRGDVLDWDDERLVRAVRGELGRAMKVTAAPAFTHVCRWPRAIPQYHVGHLDRVRRIEERLARHPGLFLGGNAYRGVAMNDCTEQGALLAAQVKGFLGGA